MKRPWEILAAGFVLGEVLAFRFSFAAIPAPLICAGVLFLTAKKRKRREKTYPLLCLFLGMCFLGAVRTYAASFPGKQEQELARICAENENTEQTFRIRGMERKGKNLVLKTGCLLVYVPTEEEDMGVYRKKAAEICGAVSGNGLPKIGNLVRVRGKLSGMEAASNPGQFSFQAYYRASGITHRMFAESVSVLDGSTDPFPEAVFEIRQYLSAILTESLEAEDAGFLKAALLGDRGDLSEEMYALYRENGIAHLLAISGLHVGILGLGLYRMLRKRGFGFISCGAAAGGFLVFYGFLTGASSSVVRAVTMLLLFFLAEGLGRTYDLLSAACLAAVGILLVHPYQLFQCGFQLSFLAVLSIGGPAKALLSRYRIRNPLLQSLTVSGCVSFLSMPFIAWWFFSVPPYGIFLNLIVIPLMQYLVLSGIAVFFLSFLGAFPMLTAAGITHRILQLYSYLCQQISALPFHRLLTGRPRPFQIILYYLLLSLALFLLLRKDQQSKAEKTRKTGGTTERTVPACSGQISGKRTAFLRAAAVAVLLPVSVLMLLHIPDAKTQLYFLDVGQGDCIVLLDGSSATLIDGGSSTSGDAGAYILMPFLSSMGVEKVDRIFISHADGDHTNAVEYLLKPDTEIKVRSVFLSLPAKEDPKYNTLRKEIAEKGCALTYLGTGDVIEKRDETGKMDGAGEVDGTGERSGTAENASPGQLSALPAWRITCLSPRKDMNDFRETNEESLVLLFEQEKFRALFTGDAGKKSEEAILLLAENNPTLRQALTGITVLKAGHHGSRNSGREDFITLLDPKYTVLSYGKKNRYGHPNEETLETLRQTRTRIYRTAVSGAVRITTDGRKAGAAGYLGEKDVR